MKLFSIWRISSRQLRGLLVGLALSGTVLGAGSAPPPLTEETIDLRFALLSAQAQALDARQQALEAQIQLLNRDRAAWDLSRAAFKVELDAHFQCQYSLQARKCADPPPAGADASDTKGGS